MSDRKHCVPNTTLCAIFILKGTVKEPESARKYAYACTWSYEVKRFASTPCWNRIFEHCQREKDGGAGGRSVFVCAICLPLLASVNKFLMRN